MSTTKKIKYPSGLRIYRTFDKTSEVWTIDNRALSIAEFTLDIGDSSNCTLDNAPGETTQTVVVPSKQRSEEIYITKTFPWSLELKFSLTETPLPFEEQKSALDQFKVEWNEKVEVSEKYFKKIPYEVLTQQQIADEMAKLGQENFIDPHFPPRDTSLYNVVEDQYPFNFIVHWRRPHEFMNNPVVFEDDIDPNDIRQGSLGDCWFLSALSSLAERPAMVRRLFVTQEYNKEGIYQIRMCKNGEWVTVTVDDYIPCRYKGGPMFSRGVGNELWVMLVEKAYAKIHGSYHALTSGSAQHSLADLSGCPTEHISFPKEKEDYEDIEEEAEEIYEKLLEAAQKGHLICTSTHGVDESTEDESPEVEEGLVSGHVYSIIRVREGLGVKLLNIRNPWGEFEWNGAWGNESEEWTEEMKEEFDPILGANDGSFWMCLEDFMMKFNDIAICKIQNYDEIRFKGKFLKVKSKDESHEFALSKFY
ncbi:unnamed protein product [Moneuplotes crassus]|uniref:Calpain catalytic domain-containing protein n=1 Tax=Euplotes crassus TaxID=5936 RepID=A0AAD1XZP0_EUPCR|nr:unnamed protein product [Moneuplotes crassus]